MGGKLTDEGAVDASTVWIKNGSQRGADSLYVGLYEDSVEPAQNATLSTITETSVANGYARIQLTDAGWTVGSTGISTHSQQTFTASGADWDPIYGYFITDVASGTGGDLFFVEHLANIGPVTVLDGLDFKITPIITAS